jgi:hypothetical protein
MVDVAIVPAHTNSITFLLDKAYFYNELIIQAREESRADRQASSQKRMVFKM